MICQPLLDHEAVLYINCEMIVIKRLKKQKKVFFDRGNFDNYCVYVGDDYGKKEALKDGEYFNYFSSIKPIYGNKIFDDFMKIYEITNKRVTQQARVIIDEIVSTYQVEHQDNVEMYFTIMYGGMVAELNKEKTMLGKRIKLLGMHQVMNEDFNPEIAANFSRNKSWQELDGEMKNRGI